MLNLASYLPDYCLKPELGPKMYIAYGSALYSSKGKHDNFFHSITYKYCEKKTREM